MDTANSPSRTVLVDQSKEKWMSLVLRQFEVLDHAVTSSSGAWALRYDGDGRAVISHENGETTWAAGAVGTLRLELQGALAVSREGQEVWRSDFPDLGNAHLVVTDEGDGLLRDGRGVPVHSLLHGPVEPVPLGDRAPLAEIGGSRFLVSDNGRRTVTRVGDGALLLATNFGMGMSASVGVSAEETRTLDLPDTWLTWRFLVEGRRGRWVLVLVDGEDRVRWRFGAGHLAADEPQPSEVAAPPPLDGDWMDQGLGMDGVYCVTVIRDVDPDEALRRFGVEDHQVSTSTWSELVIRADREEVGHRHQVIAAIGLGPHTLLVEDNGYAAVNRPDLSQGTFAVSSYRNVNADTRFAVHRDGVVLATFEENMPSLAEGTNPGVLQKALAELGIDNPEAFDEDDDNDLQDLDLLCGLVEVHPTFTDVTGFARVAIVELPSRW